MKSAHKVFPDKGIVAYRVWDRATLEGMKALFLRIDADPLYSADYRGLADFRGAQLGLSLADVRALAQFVIAELRYNPLWVTLVNEPAVTALSMVFGRIVASQYGVIVCSTEARASELLHVRVRPLLDALTSAKEPVVESHRVI